MSHELRTPLGSILGFAQLIDSAVPPPNPTQKRSVDQILKAGWYLLELIDEILDLALIESGKLQLAQEPVSLAEVMRECETMIEPLALQRGIDVAFTPLELPRFVDADRTRVKQVLMNLLSNAIKYNRVGGSVTVACTAGSASNSIRISVHDSGAGLDGQQLTQLFQPFNRLGQQSMEEGTGIGLVVCKRLVELMHGVIGAQSVLGQGSVFWVELNLTLTPTDVTDPQQYLAMAQARTQGGAPRQTLLYLEENPTTLMLVEDLVARRPDICLLTARDGIRGLELARAARPDVILIDLNLPGISAVQALQILTNDATTAHIPVVALSATAAPSEIEKCLQAGFFRYLTKPIKVIEFMETLDVALKFSHQRASHAAPKESLQ